MHGVRRGAQASSDLAEQRAAEERYIRLGEEAGRVLASRYADDTQKFLSDSARVLRENPEEYSLWNRRREILLEALRHRPFDPQATLSPLPKTAAEAFEEELALSAQALQSNPKAYAAWAHRVWLLRVCSGVGDHSGARPSSYAAQALRKELQLCERVLQMDDRNFLVWAHRMLILRLMQHAAIPLNDSIEDAASASVASSIREATLHFTLSKLLRNSSNYSAYHYRSVLGVRDVHPEGVLDLREELDLVHNAIFTEPNDQSAWFYLQWLLRECTASVSNGVGGQPGMSSTGVRPVPALDLADELNLIEELLRLTPGARWAVHARANILCHLSRHDEALTLYRDVLPALDPPRAGMYRDLATKMEQRAPSTLGNS
ncbi:hypothetical protein CDCA_CDCA02G0677 [Cyanidium caldarium]|uniref:Geranylgeranyl transferase type-2 subunit alpha n=1 Tax=Cyanidium caldarium TaxID=2771 RepID=A0AAV9IQY6_CYACA|nr:hypothetical protein CDCA_CDCA02G0677 [Cyanidium caldarium]